MFTFHKTFLVTYFTAVMTPKPSKMSGIQHVSPDHHSDFGNKRWFMDVYQTLLKMDDTLRHGGQHPKRRDLSKAHIRNCFFGFFWFFLFFSFCCSAAAVIWKVLADVACAGRTPPCQLPHLERLRFGKQSGEEEGLFSMPAYMKKSSVRPVEERAPPQRQFILN